MYASREARTTECLLTTLLFENEVEYKAFLDGVVETVDVVPEAIDLLFKLITRSLYVAENLDDIVEAYASKYQKYDHGYRRNEEENICMYKGFHRK